MTPEQYESALDDLRERLDQKDHELTKAISTIADMKRENDRLAGQLKKNSVSVITNRVVDAASALLSDVRWPGKVAEHMMAGRIAKPPLEKVRALYAEELARERLTGARALVATLPHVDDPYATLARAIQDDMQFFNSEKVLPDDYPVYGGYFYLADGVVYQSEWHGINVGELKRRQKFTEVRGCDWRRYNGTAQQMEDLRTGKYWKKLGGGA